MSWKKNKKKHRTQKCEKSVQSAESESANADLKYSDDEYEKYDIVFSTPSIKVPIMTLNGQTYD